MFIGIDPGIKGAICILFDKLDKAQFWDIDKISTLKQYKFMDPVIYVERQVALQKQQGAGTTMKNYGIILGHLQAYGFEYTEVRSQDWMGKLRVKSGLAYAKRKKVIAEKVLHIYPSAEKDVYGPQGGLLDGRTDALGVAHYAKETYVSPS
jgi:hypothetical protein